jgi:hypothetical protein
MWANFLVALSNFVAVEFCEYIFFPANLSLWQELLLSVMVSSSVMMYLSERKHHLPGIFPFNEFSWHFLQLDRIMAIVCTLFVLYRMTEFPSHKFEMSLIIGGFGLCCLFISEQFELPIKYFVILHSAWHFAAFFVLYLSFSI